jgi:fatty acid desaturase
VAVLTAEQRRQLHLLARAPRIAWPTVLLFIAAFGLWLFAFAGHAAGLIPWWAALVLGFLAVYSLYMVMHEAAHASLTSSRIANFIFGSLAALAYFSPYSIYRQAHLNHHAHTNEPDNDPDFYSSKSPHLRHWLVQDAYYGRCFIRNRSKHQASDWAAFALPLAFSAVIIVAALAYGYGWSLLFAWIIPWRLAVPWLTFAFTYLPHAPYEVQQRVNRYAATVCRRPGWLKWLLYFQNYHISHHLYPSAPFYRTEKIWQVAEPHFVEQGTRVV